MRKWKKLVSTLVLLLVGCVAFEAPANAAATYFDDVAGRSWYSKAVYYCAEHGIMQGNGNHRFDPNGMVTRAMLARVIGANENVDMGAEPEVLFPDVALDQWYAPYIYWAAENEIIVGYEDGTFAPDQTVTREEMMTVLHRYAAYRQEDTTADLTELDVFEDRDSVGDWAQEGVAWCLQKQYFNGMTPTLLKPQDTLNRAQLSKIMTVRDSGEAYTFKPGPVAGRRTVKNFLNTAMEPVGRTMYIYGGGWNIYQHGASKEARTIGVDPQWQEFFMKQGKNYDYEDWYFRSNLGLDCAGFVGWTLYNTLETTNWRNGYVMDATFMARNFSQRGWGQYIPSTKLKNHRPGDIMSTNGHVWISLGDCADGSVVLVHSSPYGVTITGTTKPDGDTHSQAIELSNYYMSKYFPAWFSRYPDNHREESYLTDYSAMRWHLDGRGVLTDPDNYTQMTPQEILVDLIGE